VAHPALDALPTDLGRERSPSRCGFLGLVTASAGLAALPSVLAACGGGFAGQPAVNQSRGILGRQLKMTVAADEGKPANDFLHLLKRATESSTSFDYDKVRQALDSTKSFDGILGKLTFGVSEHHLLSEESVTLAKVTGPKVPESLGFLPQIAS
jgi:hypothetical protein